MFIQNVLNTRPRRIALHWHFSRACHSTNAPPAPLLYSIVFYIQMISARESVWFSCTLHTHSHVPTHTYIYVYFHSTNAPPAPLLYFIYKWSLRESVQFSLMDIHFPQLIYNTYIVFTKCIFKYIYFKKISAGECNIFMSIHLPSFKDKTEQQYIIWCMTPTIWTCGNTLSVATTTELYNLVYMRPFIWLMVSADGGLIK